MSETVHVIHPREHPVAECCKVIFQWDGQKGGALFKEIKVEGLTSDAWRYPVIYPNTQPWEAGHANETYQLFYAMKDKGCALERDAEERYEAEPHTSALRWFRDFPMPVTWLIPIACLTKSRRLGLCHNIAMRECLSSTAWGVDALEQYVERRMKVALYTLEGVCHPHERATQRPTLSNWRIGVDRHRRNLSMQSGIDDVHFIVAYFCFGMMTILGKKYIYNLLHTLHVN